MTTPLHSTLKRALVIGSQEYVVTLTSESLKLTLKGKRKGLEIVWAALVDGEAALAVALHASVGAFSAGGMPSMQKSKPSFTRVAKKAKPRPIPRGSKPRQKAEYFGVSPAPHSEIPAGSTHPVL